ncbi:rCG63542 [Rattus norvegicus]|uniref:RCG63542 n=1 Tax=Rattus norvegicus TaxID=10116 RepID=A6JBG1_RAT|nr:rCG63542 [Rattus norvegicus]
MTTTGGEQVGAPGRGQALLCFAATGSCRSISSPQSFQSPFLLGKCFCDLSTDLSEGTGPRLRKLGPHSEELHSSQGKKAVPASVLRDAKAAFSSCRPHRLWSSMHRSREKVS